jgi:hypothetical protein
MKNILDEIVDELLKSINLNERNQSEIDDLRKIVLDDFYGKVILKSIGSVSLEKKELFLNELRGKENDANSILEAVGKFISNPEKLIAEVMVDFKKDLKKHLLKI